MILSRTFRSGGDEPGFEAIRGCVHKRRALNTRLSSGTSAGTYYHAQPRPFTPQLFLDFCAVFFPDCLEVLIFLVITIHQVIWPSPGTLLIMLCGFKTKIKIKINAHASHGGTPFWWLRMRLVWGWRKSSDASQPVKL